MGCSRKVREDRAPPGAVHWRRVPTNPIPSPGVAAHRTTGSGRMRIMADADACPIKAQIYRMAARYSLPVLVVANSPMRVPDQADVEFVHVPGGLDAVDDWIAEAATPADIVTTADILLAGRVVDKGAVCIDF